MNTNDGNSPQQGDNGVVWGAIAGAVISAYSAHRANKAQQAEAEKNRQFQSGASDTAHQREVADLRAAGLNPILSGTGGPGSSTPGGAMAPQQSVAPGGAQTALSLIRQRQELKNMRGTEKLINSQKQVADWSAADAYYKSEVNRKESTLQSYRDLIMSRTNRIDALRFGGNVDEAELWSSEEYSKKRKLDAVTDSIGKGVKAFSPFRFNFGSSRGKN